MNRIPDLIRVADALVAAYLRDRVKVARICDEELDRSGALLGYLRDAAQSLPRKEETHEQTRQ